MKLLTFYFEGFLPNRVLSLKTEQETGSEVLYVLHTELMVRTEILLKISCKVNFNSLNEKH